MKKAKIILACVAILAVVGGALAFKAYRLPPNVFTLLPGNKQTTIQVGPIVYRTTIPNCTLTDLATTNVGNPVNVSSTTTAAAVTTVFTSAGHPDIIATYPYCTLWNTRVTPADQ